MEARNEFSTTQETPKSLCDSNSFHTNEENECPDSEYEVIGDDYSKFQTPRGSYISKQSEQKTLKTKGEQTESEGKAVEPRKPSMQTKIFTFFTIIR